MKFSQANVLPKSTSAKLGHVQINSERLWGCIISFSYLEAVGLSIKVQ